MVLRAGLPGRRGSGPASMTRHFARVATVDVLGEDVSRKGEDVSRKEDSEITVTSPQGSF